MNNDGFGQMGAGDSDMRIAGNDLQHFRQPKTADENPSGLIRVHRMASGQGGPIKEALNAEAARHKEAKAMRMKHLEDHYTR